MLNSKRIFFICLVACLLFTQRVFADIYGFQLTISATNLESMVELQNGNTVTSDLVESGKLNFNLAVVDPSDPSRTLKVDSWKVSVYDEAGTQLSNFTLTVQSKTDSTYQAVLNFLGDPSTLSGQVLVVKAQAVIGAQNSNEVSFRLVLADDLSAIAPTGQVSQTTNFSTGKITLPATGIMSQNSFNSWLIYLLGITLGLYLIIIFYKRKKKKQEEENNPQAAQPVNKSIDGFK